MDQRGRGVWRWIACAVINLARVWAYVSYPGQMIRFRRAVGYWPDPALPKSSNEKYLWRKVFDRNPEFVRASDKLEAKVMAQTLCPQVQVPRVLWTGTRAEAIPDQMLSGNVVVKANHGSGWNILVHNGKHDRDELNRTANGWMRRRFGRHHAEWGYHGVQPRLFVDEMLLEPDGSPLANEFKSYAGRNGTIAFTFNRQLDAAGNRVDAVIDSAGQIVGGSSNTNELSTSVGVPDRYNELCEVTRKLAVAFDFARVDLYLHQGDIYFSEFTLYSYGGLAWMDNGRMMGALSDVWDLREAWLMCTPQSGLRGVYAQALAQMYDHDQGIAHEHARYAAG
jgi:hypothetical protein